MPTPQDVDRWKATFVTDSDSDVCYYYIDLQD